MIETSLYTLFLIGLFGGVHCAGMCGGIIGAVGLMGSRPAGPVRVPDASAARRTTLPPRPIVAIQTVSLAPPGATVHHQALRSTRSRAARLLTVNLGRIGTYTALGALAGGVGSTAWLLNAWLPVQQVAFVVANLLLIVMGCYLMGARRIISAVEALGAPLWARLQPYASRLIGQSGVAAEVLAGGLWGLVPCGMVYLALMTALATADPLQGATVMLVFGLGTLPNLLLLGWSGQWLARFRRHRSVRLALGGLIVLFGLLGLLRIDAALGLPILGELCFQPS